MCLHGRLTRAGKGKPQSGERHVTGRHDALRESTALQAYAASLGFDWPDIEGVLDKLIEETQEIRAAVHQQDIEHARSELGDLLLAAVNAARFLGADPEAELARANARFSRRFEAVCTEVNRQGKRMESCTLDELDAIWNRVKVRADEGLEEGG